MHQTIQPPLKGCSKLQAIVNCCSTKTTFMKRLIVIFALLITFSCQRDEQIVPRKSEHVATPSVEETSDPKNRSANARIGPPRLWYFYRGQSTTNLRYAYSDNGGTSWSGDQIFNNGIGSTTSPDVIHRFQDKFYAFYKGGGSYNIYYSSSTDGMNWQPNTQIPGIQTGFAPQVVMANNRYYVFFVKDFLVYYTSSTDLTNWSIQRLVPYSVNNGAITVAGSTLFFSYPGPDGNFYLNYKTINYSAGEILSFSDSDGVYNTSGDPIQTSTGVGVATGPDGSLYVAYKSPSGGRLNIFKGCLGSGFYCNGGTVYWSGAYTSNGPSLLYTNYNEFLLVYKSLSSGAILYGKSSDGMSWSSNHGALGQTTSGGPRLVIEY
jgi:hypothetical protein